MSSATDPLIVPRVASPGRRVLRMPFLLVAIGVAALLIGLSYIGNNSIEKTTYDVTSSRLPTSFDGFCIAQISDLHDHRFGPFQPRIMRYVREARPDVIVITGDITQEGRLRIQDMRDLAQQLTAVAPVYFVTGNHEASCPDLPGLLIEIEQAGITVLRSSSVTLQRGDQQIAIAGIDDPQIFHVWGRPWREMVVQWQTELVRLRTSLNVETFTVLLSHRPEFLRTYARLGFDLVLAGHAHGGQVRLPGIGGLYAPNQGWLPRYTTGVYRNEGTAEVVSRGLGGSIFPIRVFNRPEVVVVRLRSQQ
jgi:predicted MPP superfamily phosphohydrolase